MDSIDFRIAVACSSGNTGHGRVLAVRQLTSRFARTQQPGRDAHRALHFSTTSKDDHDPSLRGARPRIHSIARFHHARPSNVWHASIKRKTNLPRGSLPQLLVGVFDPVFSCCCTHKHHVPSHVLTRAFVENMAPMTGPNRNQTHPASPLVLNSLFESRKRFPLVCRPCFVDGRAVDGWLLAKKLIILCSVLKASMS